MDLAPTRLRRYITVVAVLLAAIGILFLIVAPTQVGRFSVAVLAPVIAWLALPTIRQENRCPVCGARTRSQHDGPTTTRVDAATRAAAPGGTVAVTYGWEVVTCSVSTCVRCGSRRELQERHFVSRAVAPTPAEAVVLAGSDQVPVESRGVRVLGPTN